MGEASGPVEREARQLVEAAARWLSAVPDPTPDSYADRSPESARAAGEMAEEEVADARATPGGKTGEIGDAKAGQTPEGEAGEHLCRGCPWCRAKAAAGPIGADTLDSLAQLLGAAAESLSLFAQSRREAAERSEQPAPEDPTTKEQQDR